MCLGVGVCGCVCLCLFVCGCGSVFVFFCSTFPAQVQGPLHFRLTFMVVTGRSPHWCMCRFGQDAQRNVEHGQPWRDSGGDEKKNASIESCPCHEGFHPIKRRPSFPRQPRPKASRYRSISFQVVRGLRKGNGVSPVPFPSIPSCAMHDRLILSKLICVYSYIYFYFLQKKYFKNLSHHCNSGRRCP